MIRRLLALLHQFRSSSLLVNSVYLMLATSAVAGFGFVFWVVVSRNYAASAVGLAATLLSVSNLLAMLSLAGFDTTFVRFLPKTKRRQDHINTGMMVVGLISGGLSLAFTLALPLVSPKLAFVLHHPLYLAAFVFFTVVTALNILTNAVFLALKCAKDIFIINLLFSVVRVALPLLITHGTVITLFVMAGISQLAGLALSLLIIKAQLRHDFAFRVHRHVVREVKKYSSAVYVASVFNLLPPTLMPLLIVHRLNAENAAYYYMAFTIASVLYTVAYSAMQSVFAEGSHDENALKTHLRKAAKLVGALLTPAIIALLGLSHFVLGIFGDQYAAKGSALLQLFALSALAVAASSAAGAIFKVMRHLREVVAMNMIYATVILGISYLLMPRLGVVAIGWAWMLGNVAAASTGVFLLRRTATNFIK